MTTNVILATISGYCSCTICCGPNAQGRTASGRAPLEHQTVAGPRTYPLGTRCIIHNVGTYTIEDRTSRKYNGRFDIYFSNHTEALRFGIRTNTVTIITK